MTRAYTPKPFTERNINSLTIPLSIAVVETLEREARRRSVPKTVLARSLIVEGLDRIGKMAYGST